LHPYGLLELTVSLLPSSQSVEDASSYYQKQLVRELSRFRFCLTQKLQLDAKMKKTQQLLAHTPAKSRYFAAKCPRLFPSLLLPRCCCWCVCPLFRRCANLALTTTASPLRMNLEQAFDSAATKPDTVTASAPPGMGDTDAVRRLEKSLEKKHDQAFIQPSQLAAVAVNSPDDRTGDDTSKVSMG
jgi:hypothetical protein